jgi:hypothetical protein
LTHLADGASDHESWPDLSLGSVNPIVIAGFFTTFTCLRILSFPPVINSTITRMNVLILLSLLFFVPFLCFLAYLAASSCMGDGLRARVGGMTFNRSYGRGLRGGSSAGGWEQIEMEDMLGEDTEDED